MRGSARLSKPRKIRLSWTVVARRKKGWVAIVELEDKEEEEEEEEELAAEEDFLTLPPPPTALVSNQQLSPRSLQFRSRASPPGCVVVLDVVAFAAAELPPMRVRTVVPLLLSPSRLLKNASRLTCVSRLLRIKA